jgi:hypothetical protein
MRRDHVLENLAERSPIDVLHRDIANLVILADEVDPGDAGVIQLSDGLGFPAGTGRLRNGRSRLCRGP